MSSVLTESREPIAIVGIGCRFPGASGPKAFWRLMRDGVDAISEIPSERFDIDPIYDPTSTTPGTLCSRFGGFLEQVDQFDPGFFGISPREAAAMDPQQRLLLEVAWEAMEDAGQVQERFAGSRTGVWIGSCNSDYADLLDDPTRLDIYFTAGVALGVLTGRLSFALGLQGPSVTVDAACASSLVTVHMACQNLWSGECSLALAGGVNLILNPESGIGFSMAKALAPGGRCKFGDARADGFVRSDGVGVVVLRRLSDAVAEGDRIYAVIRGGAVNNDGRSGGFLMTPSRLGQEAVLREAYRNAGVSPGDVQYVECHGTGTSVGDPLELRALGGVLAEGRAHDHLCAVGSVKTNIGHTEGAAGIAGLIKVALSLKHRVIPASIHFQDPNPRIPWQDLPLYVQPESGPWPVNSGPARAGVSSFGISGCNAHVVLEEAPRTSQDQEAKCGAKAQLLPLSARSPEALKALAQCYEELLGSDTESPSSLEAITYTASCRRTHHDHRLAAVGHSREELAEQLEAFRRDDGYLTVSSGRSIDGPGFERRLVFVFSGQGSQWLGMGRELLDSEPVFREALESCDQALREYVNWSLLEELAADDSRSRLDQVDVVQPTIFAIQVALAALWRSWGIEPDAVVGQSLGEIAAACVAGALSLDDAARVICRRSQLVKSTSGQGGMAVVGLSSQDAQHRLDGYEDRVSVAVSSSPVSTVLSGDTKALREILDRLEHERQDVFCRWVNVDHASHSPQMDQLRAAMLQNLEGLQPRTSSVPIYSTVNGELTDGKEFDAAYWVRNQREPVLLSTAVQKLVEDGHHAFLEISPDPVLLSAIQQSLEHLGQEGTVLPSLRKQRERAAMLDSLGALYALGFPVDWSRLYPAGGRFVDLPSYPWQRERYWLEGLKWSNGNRHPLLGRHLNSAAQPGTHFWEVSLGAQSVQYLGDHLVQGLAVLPAAAFLEMALAAATEAYGEAPHVLEDVTFQKALFLPADSTQKIQLILSSQLPGEAAFQFFTSQESPEETKQTSWTLHAKGTVRLGKAKEVTPPSKHSSSGDIRARCQESISDTDFYLIMEEHGLQYGPSFRSVERAWRQNGEAIGRLRLPESVASQTGAYQVHPALLDACFQVLMASIPREDVRSGENDIFLPVELACLRVHDSPDKGIWSHTVLKSDLRATGDVLTGDIFLLDERGRVVLEALNLRIQRLGHDDHRSGTPDVSDEWLYEIQWQPEEACAGARDVVNEPLPSIGGSWLIFADTDGVGKALATRLTKRGERCVLVSPGETYRRTYRRANRESFQIDPMRSEDMRTLLTDAFGADQPACRGIIHLWSLDVPPSEETTLESLELAQNQGCMTILHLVQALADTDWAKLPRLWLVTRGAQAIGTEVDSVSIGQSPVWGMGRVISIEHPELRCKKVDLGSASRSDQAQSLLRELSSADHEDQIALRGNSRYLARLVPHSPEPKKETRRLSSRDEAFQLELPNRGALDDFTLRATTRREPGPGEVEIAVVAVGLNFRDILIALDMLPSPVEGALNLGWECSGRIAAIGAGVEGFVVGDKVIAFAPSCFSSYAITSANFVLPKPADLSFEEAATIPIVFATAYYALYSLGRLGKGDRVLIHAAAGGVGQAAVQLAQRAGAEIYATAGSPEKRKFLRSQGIKHVFDSRSLGFAEEVLRRTDGEGVDVVLNSLSGEFIPKGLSTLRAGGRFLEIGKIDITQNRQLGLGQLENNISFFAIDLGRLFLERPDILGSLLCEVTSLFEQGTLRPLPLRVFPISQTADAFRYMAQARHTGKVVISLNEEVLVAPAARQPVTFRADGTYLITGGLGGLGLEVAQWMAEQGARRLVLMARSGVTSAAASIALETMRESGVQVVVAQADVAEEIQVANVLAEIRHVMPPLRGIIHAAAVLDDCILLRLNDDRLSTVMAPKINGAWNLHSLTLSDPLDFFLLFSSAASMLGSPGQGNYVAANTFLDALAHHRHALGLPALAINWGAWAEVGLAARPDRARHLIQQGVVPFAPKQGIQLLERLLQRDPIQVMAASIDWSRLSNSHSPPLLSQLAGLDAGSGPLKSGVKRNSLTRDKLLAAEPNARRQLLEAFLKEHLARVLRSTPSKLEVHLPLNNLGIDSLMAVELKNRVENDLEVNMPVTAFVTNPTLAQLTLLLDQLITPTSTPAAQSTTNK